MFTHSFPHLLYILSKFFLDVNYATSARNIRVEKPSPRPYGAWTAEREGKIGRKRTFPPVARAM